MGGDGYATVTEQPTTDAAPTIRPPWNPGSVALMTLLLPAGGAVLTVRNLQRMGEIDTPAARRLAFAAVLVFGVGQAALLLAARKSGGPITQDANVIWFVRGGTAVASYFAQRLAYRNWRVGNPSTRTGSWMSGLGTLIIYELLSYAMASGLVLIAVSLGLTPPLPTT